MRVLSPISTKQLYNRNDASCPSKRQHASQSSSSSSSSSHHPLPLALADDHSEPASKKKMMTFHHRQHEYLPLPQRRDHQHHQYEYLPLPRKPTSRHNPTSRPHKKKSTASCLCYNKAPRHHKSCMLSHQRSILLKRHHHHQRHNRRVTFGQTSVVHILHNHHLISRPYKEPSSADALWLTSSQIAQNKRKMVLFAYMLKTKRLKMNQSELEDKGMLWGLERHLFDDDSDDDEDDEDSQGGADSQGGGDESISSISPPRPSINGHEGGDESGTNNGTNASASASSSTSGEKCSSNTIASASAIRSGSSTSKRRQQVFAAVLQEQHRQSQIGIWDVEALAKVSMEKSQGARERARVIGVLQQQSI